MRRVFGDRELCPDLSGRFHLLTGQGSGAAALVRLLAALPAGARFQVVYAAESASGADDVESLRSHCGTWLHIAPGRAEAVAAVERLLAGCAMGARLYITGPESFIGLMTQVASSHDMHSDEVQCQRCGSGARRVHCVHCKAPNDDVTTNIVKCEGCGRYLLVRDHYSPRLGAYLGVMVDAECPAPSRRSSR